MDDDLKQFIRALLDEPTAEASLTRGTVETTPPGATVEQWTVTDGLTVVLTVHGGATDVPLAPPAVCLDCGLAYEAFPLDVTLSRAQWLTIHPDEHGLLCAACIVARAARVPGALVVHATIEFAPRGVV